jgi:hypothetical protein
MTTTIEEFQKNPGPFIEKVQQGTELLLTCEHHPSLKLTSVFEIKKSERSRDQRKRTIRRPAGWARGKIKIAGNIDGPILTKEEWGRLWPGE